MADTSLFYLLPAATPARLFTLPQSLPAATSVLYALASDVEDTAQYSVAACSEALLTVLLPQPSPGGATPDHAAAARAVAAQAAAAAHSIAQLANRLLELGADPDHVRQEDGLSPLLAAVQGGHADVAALLLEAGALPDGPAAQAAEPGTPAATSVAALDTPATAEQAAAGRSAKRKRQGEGVQQNGGQPAARPLQPTPLVQGLAARSAALVERLLAAGADVNLACSVQGSQGSTVQLTPLIAAVSAGDAALVARLLEAGADVHKKCATANGSDWTSALSAAVLSGSLELVQLLVSHGACAPRNGGQFVARDHAALRAVALAAQRGRVDMLEVLYPPLAKALQGGSSAMVGTTRRRTSLHPLAAAAERGQLAAVERLLELGAPPNHDGSVAAGVLQCTPLQLAAGNGHLAVVARLLAAGSSPTRTNSREEMAVTLALKRGHLAVLTNASKAWQMGFASGMLPRMRPLSLAALEQERQRFQLLLLALLRAHASSGGSAKSRAAAAAEVRQLATPAAVANAAAGSEALLGALLACGVSLGVVDPGDGSFPLLAAAHNGWQPMLRLLQHGADPNQCDALGNSCCHLLASRPGMLETAQHLLAWHFGRQGGETAGGGRSDGSDTQQQQQQGQQQQPGQQQPGQQQQPHAPQPSQQQLDVGRLNTAGLDALGTALAAKNRKCAELLLEYLIVAQQREQREQREQRARQLAAASAAAEPAGAAANGAAAEQAAATPAAAGPVLPPVAEVQPTAAAAKACDLLVELGAKALADINKPREPEGQHILVTQVPSASRKQLRQLLALPGLDVNARGPSGRTPVMLAVERGQPGILSDLLATGRVDLAARDSVTGANAVLLAARSADAAVLRVLLDAGADVCCVDNTGESLLMALACRNQHKLLAELLRGPAMALLNLQDAAGFSALIHAAVVGSSGACRVLRSYGADPGLRTAEDGKTAFELAAAAGHTACLPFLKPKEQA
ncbi:ankyrin repeat domain-containing 50-like [Chlorella sorokiniana]|uniref:Ankyrin repeat domain-containing 50-like n=1 Tax=Chlorella sorokiniana TaxID=3076 RepID=A0A2P6TSB8_CHLSO|nr:ankyrin repeat domain-containing 50-like [Chlorella sorokiniana]|eukprot:PRW56961.1 ankyrin repeat domain-containing 50-like [Chlorella sorokiniana]